MSYVIYTFLFSEMLISFDAFGHKHKSYGDISYFPRGMVNPIKGQKYHGLIVSYIYKNASTINKRVRNIDFDKLGEIEVLSIKKDNNEIHVLVDFIIPPDFNYQVFVLDERGKVERYY